MSSILTCIQLRPLATVSTRGTLIPHQILHYINFNKLLRPLFPGQAPTVRRNMYNVVLVFDLSRPFCLHFIANTLSMLIDRSYPVRFGLVPIIETEDGAKMAKVFYYLVQNYGRQATMQFFSSVCIMSLCNRSRSCLVRSFMR